MNKTLHTHSRGSPLNPQPTMALRFDQTGQTEQDNQHRQDRHPPMSVDAPTATTRNIIIAVLPPMSQS